MPAIVFDVLVPEAEFDGLLARFSRLANRMSEVEGAEVTVRGQQPVAMDADVEKQLRAQGDGVPSRFYVDIDGSVRSLNQTAMLFSRFLTPQADLPAEPVALHNEEAFEVDAVFPWTVAIEP
ncbi:hypothetical protein [Corynebacterium epidermidicanis]|uniref:Uncharacterized protein n=1 Tax=Corynebacterium epidermidicanis TaxID=1050174 RepID=A0A0G3GX61_9CORY|nr:hypothetical protein [Corynebacterium epidermidicanis]AKK03457.1 hypothetical protein CEPID_08035 [Corynebacterium epidermidicanis]